MPQVDSNDIPFNRSGQAAAAPVTAASSESRLNNIIEDIARDDDANGNRFRAPQRSSGAGSYICIVIFLILMATYVGFNKSHRKVDAVVNNEKAGVQSQPNPVQPQQPPVQSQQNNEPSLEVGSTAPDFALPNLFDSQIKLSDYRGKVVLLEFWTSWCEYCTAAVPKLVSLQDRYWEKDFVIIAVAADKGPDIRDKLRHFADQNGINYPVVYDNSFNVERAYNIKSVPTTFVIDKQGRITNKFIGMDDATYNALPDQIDCLLQM